MKKMQALYNSDANKIVKEAAQEKSANKSLIFLIDLAMVASNTKPTEDEAQTFNRAWSNPNLESCRKWHEAIGKEFKDRSKQQVWQKMHKNLMLLNCRCIKNKWDFNIKHNGVYHVQFVACGYSQVPGIDFSKNYSPVVNVITCHILLLMVINFEYWSKI